MNITYLGKRILTIEFFKLNYEKFKKSSHQNNWIDNSIVKQNLGTVSVISFLKARKAGDIMQFMFLSFPLGG